MTILKDITDLKVTQIRVFPVDVVPLGMITTKSCIEKIRGDLSVSQIESPPFIEGIGPIIFLRGEIKEGNRIIVINRIAVEHRRIILEVVGTSKETDHVYDVLLSSIASVTDIDSGRLRVPLLIAETTQCVATLDFHFESLFNNSFIELLNNRVRKEATNKIAKGSVRPLVAEVEISYQIKDKTLIKNSISMSPKKFTIAPRAGTPLEARRYFLSSPFDSDTHLNLVRGLEEAITKTSQVGNQGSKTVVRP